MDLKTVDQSADAIHINEFTFDKRNAFKEFLNNPSHWHKFFIDNVYGLKRDVVLRALFQHIKPYELIPLSYTVLGNGAFFFARNCGPAIEKICDDKLSVPNPIENDKPFKLKIIIKYTTVNDVKVDLSGNVLKVLEKRYKKSVLCLDSFCEDPDLSEYFLLSQSRLLAFVLNIARNLKPTGLKLCHNEIKTLDAMKILPPENIVSFDLRHNLLTDLAELKHLDGFSITELWLEGNPLCELYDEYTYVQHVIKYCPKIEKLDGHLLRQNGVPSFRRNFLCNMSAYDVVDQFLERYFNSYDSRNLNQLESLYHNEAIFSMTVDYFENQLSSLTCQLKTYKLHGRNLQNLAEDSTKNLFVGRTEIFNLFNNLPHSEHDPYSFTVDVLLYSEKCVVLVVTGVFREFPETERLLGFNRYFVLECRNSVYRISNEQLHIFNALTSQHVTAFKKPNVLQEAKSPIQKNQMMNTFSVITNLTKDWAKMFLEECHYNFKHAMILFMDLYKNDKIPSEGFRDLIE